MAICLTTVSSVDAKVGDDECLPPLTPIIDQSKPCCKLECSICLENPIDTLLEPCNHVIVCFECSKSLKNKCPICREIITNVLKLNIPKDSKKNHDQTDQRKEDCVDLCGDRSSSRSNSATSHVAKASSPSVSTNTIKDPLTDPENPDHWETLWIGNLAPQTTEIMVLGLFERYGKIRHSRMMLEKYCIFITFENWKSAGDAMRHLQYKKIHGRYIQIKYPNWALKKKVTTEPHTRTTYSDTVSTDRTKDPLTDPENPLRTETLWVGNLFVQMTEQIILEMFGKYGKIRNSRMMLFKHCVFITYEDWKAAGQAMRELQGKDIQGQRILIRYPDVALKRKGCD